MIQCNQCGKCCLKYGGGRLGSVSQSEMDCWEANRPEVLDYVVHSDMWVSPRTGEELARCPWLRKLPNREKYKCRIHEVHPEACNGYPVNIQQMIDDGCEMIEEDDLLKPRNELERDLDKLRNESESVRWVIVDQPDD